MIRDYQEDHFEQRLAPGTGFDITTPTWRIGELILFTVRLAALFDSVQRVDLAIAYTGLAGRHLVSYGNPNRWVMEGRATRQDTYNAAASYDPAQMPGVLPETFHGLLAPLYEAFGFFELPRQLVAEELATMQRNRF